MKIAITGHRPDKLGGDYTLTSPLVLRIKDNLQQIIDTYKPHCLISGMALGIDSLWAKLAIQNSLMLHAYIPFRGQELKWPKAAQNYYHFLLEYASITTYCSDPGYAPYKMQIRNEKMVDDCDLLIGVSDGSSGGTKNCLDYAIKKGVERIIINPKTL
jgi:uncharacterized phage-like protein YoqJ